MAKIETKIQFNPNLSYQQEAVESAIKLFEGQRKTVSPFTICRGEGLFEGQAIITGEANHLMLSPEKLRSNLQAVQRNRGLDTYTHAHKNDFTVEMETGTGKTYVYLKTILNLYREYQFKKFIIVVPRKAIREGVYASLNALKEHFARLYDGIGYHHFIYDSKKPEYVTGFAMNSCIEIMIITIDSFNRDFNKEDLVANTNVIHRPHEKCHGKAPIELIAESRPIVIIDEPQSVIGTAKAKEAIASLDPLAIFRYSATHREIVNPIYKLNAIDAYNRDLVKKIEVLSVFEDSDVNGLYIKVNSVHPDKREANLEMNFIQKGIAKRVSKKVQYQSLLAEVTKNPAYEGWRMTNIDDSGIELNGNEKLYVGGIKTQHSLYSDEKLKRTMIRETIRVHFEKQLTLRKYGIKVLTLFFIDKVASYRVYDASDSRGLYARLFEEEFKQLIQDNLFYKELYDTWGADVSALHDGYFSDDGKGRLKDTRGDTDRDISTYDKIMKCKGLLLNESEPCRFIFSHTALREGWDNPNVFQICMLKDPKIKQDKNIRLRQEIGRGLRIAVNQQGERVHSKGVNILTITANDTFSDFVSKFQTELQEDEGEHFDIITPAKFQNLTYMAEDGVRHVLGAQLAGSLYSHLIASGYLERIKIKGSDHAAKPTQLLRDTLKVAPEMLVPQQEQLAPYIDAIIGRISELATRIEITRRKEKIKVKLNKCVRYSAEFQDLWDKIKYKSIYSVDFDAEKFKLRCIQRLSELEVSKIIYNIERGIIQIDSDTGVRELDDLKTDRETVAIAGKVHIPDIIRYLQNETGLKRQTLVEILTKSSTLGQIFFNPQLYMELVRDTIRSLMQHELVNGIKYTCVNDEFIMELPAEEEVEQYFTGLMAEAPNKCIVDHFPVDSEIEREFAHFLDNEAKVSCFMKLPATFKIDTPLGSYNPDWAVYVSGIDNKIYFIVETKGTNNMDDLRPSERNKILCARKHFQSVSPDIKFAAPVSNGREWLKNL